VAKEAGMSDSIWLVVDTRWCERMQAEARLLEERLYANEVLPGTDPAFMVRARKCSLGVACNLIGYPCRYAMNNPNYDPFAY
jgi:hypothetical protein